MRLPLRFEHPRPREHTVADIRRALTRAIREGLTLEEVREIVQDHLSQYSEKPDAKAT